MSYRHRLKEMFPGVEDSSMEDVDVEVVRCRWFKNLRPMVKERNKDTGTTSTKDRQR